MDSLSLMLASDKMTIDGRVDIQLLFIRTELVVVNEPIEESISIVKVVQSSSIFIVPVTFTRLSFYEEVEEDQKMCYTMS